MVTILNDPAIWADKAMELKPTWLPADLADFALQLFDDYRFLELTIPEFLQREEEFVRQFAESECVEPVVADVDGTILERGFIRCPICQEALSRDVQVWLSDYLVIHVEWQTPSRDEILQIINQRLSSLQEEKDYQARIREQQRLNRELEKIEKEQRKGRKERAKRVQLSMFP